MSAYIIDNGLNNLERNQASTVLSFGSVAEFGTRAKDNAFYQDGDVVLLGALPPESLTIDMRMLIQEGYTAGSTVDIGFANYDTDGIFDGITAFATGVPIEGGIPKHIIIDLPLGGIFDQTGAPATTGGAIWAGSDDVKLAIKLNIAVPLIDESIEIQLVSSHTYFGTKSTGGYIQ